MVENQPKEYQIQYDALRSKSDKFYLGDVCEWFYISKKLLNEVKGKYNSGYQKVKIKIAPLQYDKTQFTKEELKTIEDGNPLCHNHAIKYGGPCPITPFKTKTTLSYLDLLENETESDLIDANDDFVLHIGPKTAKIDLLSILQLILFKILVLPNKRDKLEITTGVNDFDSFWISNIHSPFCSCF